MTILSPSHDNHNLRHFHSPSHANYSSCHVTTPTVPHKQMPLSLSWQFWAPHMTTIIHVCFIVPHMSFTVPVTMSTVPHITTILLMTYAVPPMTIMVPIMTHMVPDITAAPPMMFAVPHMTVIVPVMTFTAPHMSSPSCDTKHPCHENDSSCHDIHGSTYSPFHGICNPSHDICSSPFWWQFYNSYARKKGTWAKQKTICLWYTLTDIHTHTQTCCQKHEPLMAIHCKHIQCSASKRKMIKTSFTST